MMNVEKAKAPRVTVRSCTYRGRDGYAIRWHDKQRHAFPQSMFTYERAEADRIAADVRAGREPLFDFQRRES